MMISQKAIEDAKTYIRELFAGNADGHGADHTMRVYRNAMMMKNCVKAIITKIMFLTFVGLRKQNMAAHTSSSTLLMV